MKDIVASNLTERRDEYLFEYSSMYPSDLGQVRESRGRNHAAKREEWLKRSGNIGIASQKRWSLRPFNLALVTELE